MGSHFSSLLIVLVLGTMPLWPYSRTWDDYPGGLVAMMFSAVLLLVISGRFRALIETTWPDTRQEAIDGEKARP